MTKQATSSPTLETRISAALTNDGITSTAVDALIEETIVAIAEGEASAAEEKRHAFDPALSPDPKAARERLEDALFLVGRLKTLLPRLETFAGEQRKREDIAAYATARDALEVEGAAIEQELHPDLHGVYHKDRASLPACIRVSGSRSP